MQAVRIKGVDSLRRDVRVTRHLTRLRRAVLVALFTGFLPVPALAQAEQVGLPRFPSVSPDGSELVFSWGGDLWRASTDGGQANRLTRHNLDDLHSTWSPDGEWIVFTSMRDGYMNLWRIHRDGSRLAQLTHADQHMRHPAYGQDDDGEAVVTFSTMLEADVHRDERPYRISPEGGQHRRLHDAFGSEPELSPDGQRVAFTRDGAYHSWNRRHYRGPDAMNVWLYDRQAERFEAITERDGDDGSAQWIDSDSLAFMSDRQNGTVNLYRVDLDESPRQFERITHFDERDLQSFDISRDGSTAVFHVWDTLYRMDLDDPEATPEPIMLRAAEDGRDDYQLHRIDRDVSEAALSPDGKTMAYIAYGRVYVRHMDEHSPTRLVTPRTHSRHHDLAWSPNGLSLYFTNDADGTRTIHEAQVSLTREEIRREAERQPPAERSQPAPPPSGGTSRSEPTALIAEPGEPHGEPPIPSLQHEEPEDPFAPPGPGLPTSPPPEPEPDTPIDVPEPLHQLPVEPELVDPEIVPEAALDDTPAEALPANRDPTRWHDAVRFEVTPVLESEHNDRDVSPSPDGNALAFRRGRGDLMVMDIDSGDVRTLVEGWDTSLHWRWSPDSRYIAYAQNDLNFSSNIFIVPADGSDAPVNITRHPRNDLNPRWSADGRKLTFISNRSGDSYDLYRVYLDRGLQTYTDRELNTYYRRSREAAAKRQPLSTERQERGNDESTDDEAPTLELDDAWRRLERVTASPSHQYANEMTPGGDRYVFNSGNDGLTAMNWDGSERIRLGPSVNVQHISTTGEHVVYIHNGRVGVVSLSGGKPRHPDISDRLRIDLRKQSLQKFHEAARLVGENFYRPDMKGLDWQALVEDYASLIRRARTSSEFSDIANRLMGELAASHIGISNPGPASALREPSGRLGIEKTRITLEDGREGYRVTEVIPDGPIQRSPMPLQRGDIITAIDLREFEPQETLLQRLSGRVDEEVIVTFQRPDSYGRQRDFRTLITPTDLSGLAQLKYDAFREANRQQVESLSDGRLGYLHIQAMNQTSLEGFQGDLYAAAQGKDGLIIDVRNNGGGNTTDRILTSIMAEEHAYTVPAGADPERTGHYPQDRLDAPRYTLPVNMLANEKSYSNAEILAHAFQTLERGTLVGEQTYGGVISTDTHYLIDGATVRRPFRGWYLPDGTDMEHHGAMPDLSVPQAPEDEVANRDRQLEQAVEDLLARLDSKE